MDLDGSTGTCNMHLQIRGCAAKLLKAKTQIYVTDMAREWWNWVFSFNLKLALKGWLHNERGSVASRALFVPQTKEDDELSGPSTPLDSGLAWQLQIACIKFCCSGQ